MTRPSGRGWPTTARSASNSMGSPSEVPVPCVSTYPISSGATRALASAWRSIACCESTFGVVSPVDRPSWFTAEPRISARMGSPSRCASESSLSTTTPQPSPRTNPLARGVEGLAPAVRGERPAWSAISRVVSGESIRFTPPARASVASPLRRLWQARCSGHERRGARRVHRDARSLEAEHVREPSRREGMAVPGGGVDVLALGDRRPCRDRCSRWSRCRRTRPSSSPRDGPDPGRRARAPPTPARAGGAAGGRGARPPAERCRRSARRSDPPARGGRLPSGSLVPRASTWRPRWHRVASGRRGPA